MRIAPLDLDPPRRRAAQPVCVDSAKRAILFAYVARVATDFEQRAFERHVLDCGPCYDDLLATWRVAELLEEFAQGHDAPGAMPSLVGRLHRRGSLRFALLAAAFLMLGIALGAAVF
jgi:hypothetical protein